MSPPLELRFPYSALASPCLRASGAAGTSRLELRQQMTGDDELLDLRRALVDLRDLGVAEVSLDLVLLDEAVAAVDLHRVRGHPHGGVRGKQFGHRRLGSMGPSLVLEGGGPQREQARGLDARGHVREHPRDPLMLADGPTE